jgi:DNA replication protein DnaC
VARTLSETERKVLGEYCGSPEGIARRATDEQARADERTAVGNRRALAFVRNLLPHFAGFNLDTYPHRMTAQRKVLTAVRGWLDVPDAWLLLHGLYGAGKSCLALGAATELLRRGGMRSARFQAVPKLLDSVRATYDHGAQQRGSDIMAELVDVGLLVLDDLGAERTWSACAATPA